MQNDINEAMYIIAGKKIDVNGFNNYDKIFPFTTEDVKNTLNNAKGKDILTICGSGDHFLNAVKSGANSVDVFDINILTKYYLELKKTLVEQLSYEEYIKFFFENGDLYYEKIKEYLDDSTRIFWNKIYNYFVTYFNKLIDLRLFFSMSGEEYKTLNNYFNEKDYNILKENLKNIDYNFIHSNITDLPYNIDKKYDLIYLSNIYYYVDTKIFINMIEHLKDFLNPKGIIHIAYIYDYLNHPNIEILNNIDNTELLNINSEDKYLIYKRL